MVIRSRQSSTITKTLPCRGGAVGGGRRYVGRRKKLQRKKNRVSAECKTLECCVIDLFYLYFLQALILEASKSFDIDPDTRGPLVILC
jgi:hypothetical protein